MRFAVAAHAQHGRLRFVCYMTLLIAPQPIHLLYLQAPITELHALQIHFVNVSSFDSISSSVKSIACFKPMPKTCLKPRSKATLLTPSNPLKITVLKVYRLTHNAAINGGF